MRIKFARTPAGRLYSEAAKESLKVFDSEAIRQLEDLLIGIGQRPDDEAVIVSDTDDIIFDAHSAKEELSSRIFHYKLITNAELRNKQNKHGKSIQMFL